MLRNARIFARKPGGRLAHHRTVCYRGHKGRVRPRKGRRPILDSQIAAARVFNATPVMPGSAAHDANLIHGVFTVTRIDAKDSALVLFSGGQDSATCLAWALERYKTVETLGFDYGQRHRVELECRDGFRAAVTREFPQWASRLGEDHMIDLSVLGAISDTAMTREIEIQATSSGLPNTFVPGRNLLFMTIAAAVAYRRGLKVLVGGMCETDFSGYPDCRDDTMKALQVALNLGMETRYLLETPLMWLDKSDTWRLAETLGGDALVELIRVETHTCYVGERAELHDWGFGCGQCPACKLRKRGYEAYRAGEQVTTEPV
jgi:7-cyano-7-deazaguanine synthase